MGKTLFDSPSFANHEGVHSFFDEKTGLKAIVAVHSTARGPAVGSPAVPRAAIGKPRSALGEFQVALREFLDVDVLEGDDADALDEAGVRRCETCIRIDRTSRGLACRDHHPGRQCPPPRKRGPTGPSKRAPERGCL